MSVMVIPGPRILTCHRARSERQQWAHFQTYELNLDDDSQAERIRKPQSAISS